MMFMMVCKAMSLIMPRLNDNIKRRELLQLQKVRALMDGKTGNKEEIKNDLNRSIICFTRSPHKPYWHPFFRTSHSQDMYKDRLGAVTNEMNTKYLENSSLYFRIPCDSALSMHLMAANWAMNCVGFWLREGTSPIVRPTTGVATDGTPHKLLSGAMPIIKMDSIKPQSYNRNVPYKDNEAYFLYSNQLDAMKQRAAQFQTMVQDGLLWSPFELYGDYKEREEFKSLAEDLEYFTQIETRAGAWEYVQKKIFVATWIVTPQFAKIISQHSGVTLLRGHPFVWLHLFV